MKKADFIAELHVDKPTSKNFRQAMAKLGIPPRIFELTVLKDGEFIINTYQNRQNFAAYSKFDTLLKPWNCDSAEYSGLVANGVHRFRVPVQALAEILVTYGTQAGSFVETPKTVVSAIERGSPLMEALLPLDKGVIDLPRASEHCLSALQTVAEVLKLNSDYRTKVTLQYGVKNRVRGGHGNLSSGATNQMQVVRNCSLPQTLRDAFDDLNKPIGGINNPKKLGYLIEMRDSAQQVATAIEAFVIKDETLRAELESKIINNISQGRGHNS